MTVMKKLMEDISFHAPERRGDRFIGPRRNPMKGCLPPESMISGGKTFTLGDSHENESECSTGGL